MIKAKKGLLITLFAAMMMFAFGAASVFATDYPAQDVQWSSDFKTAEVTYAGGTATATATLTLNSNGVTKATLENIHLGYGDQVTIADNTRYYVDLTNAVIGRYWGSFQALSGVYSLSAYKAPVWMNALQVKRPEGATGPANATATSNIGGWNITYAIDSTVAGPTKEAPITADFTAAGTKTMDGTAADRAVLVGAPVVNYLEVVADPMIEKAWYEDVYHKTPSTSPATWTQTYDAAEHVAYIADIKGYAIKYQKYDAKAGAWIDIDKVSWKNATNTAVDYRATLTPIAVDPKTPIIAESDFPTLKIAKVNPYNVLPTVKWSMSNNWDKMKDGDYIMSEEQAKDPAALLLFDNDFAADLEEIKAYFNDTYIIDKVISPIDKTKQTWQIKDNWANVSEDVKAKYATLIANYGTLAHDGLKADTAVMDVLVSDEAATNTDTNEDIVDITFAPGMTYKVKKAKKLKKTQSFTVEATTKSGKAVSWVLQTPNKKISIDATTGLVTVKKGLKKGTYKCKVTARTEKGLGFAAAQDTAELIIKIKK